MRLYNTLKREKEEFVPVTAGKVNMYVCGITAYDYCHIGHARSSVVFDVLYRYLKSQGMDVTFIRNFTDIDDKIIKRANEVGQDARDIAERFINEFYVDMDMLSVSRPDIEPKCTEHIDEMIALTQTLIDKGYAYATPSGDVYFKVRSFADYGKLSGRNIDEMESGARVALGEEKHDPLDFALWKAAKPGEPSWMSPWGEGRPGWHLECSAMSEKYVALPLDIHGGGQDLSFPHHENEIAQSEAATGTVFANYWVHNGFVQINSEKMSKSLGNFFTIRDILKTFLPETLRYFLLTMHYRSPLDFSFEALEEAEKGMKRVYAALAQIDIELGKNKWKKSVLPEEFAHELAEIERHWGEAMDDDMNTAAALGHVFSAMRLAGRLCEDKNYRKSESAREIFSRLKQDMETWGSVFGVFNQAPAEFLLKLRDNRAARVGIDPAKVHGLLEERKVARQEKDFEKSDAIRDALLQMHVEVKDTPQGATWDVLSS